MELGQKDMTALNWFGCKRVLGKLLGAPLVNPLMVAAARLFMPARIAARLPLRRKSAVYRLENSTEVTLLEPQADVIARDLFWGGGAPTSPKEALKLRCIERLSREASTFLDVGAYAGICSLVAAASNPQLRAIAYDIVPENFLLVERNVIENDLVGRIEARLRGIGRVPGSIRLPFTMGLPSNACSVSLGSKFDRGIEIPVATLDAETSTLVGPYLVKLDVEGFEEDVFKGGMGFFREERPDIICEILPDAASLCAYVEPNLKPLGYRFIEFDDSGCIERQQVQTRAEQRDWLFTVRSDVQPFLPQLF